MGELNFFKLNSKLNYFHLVSGVLLGSDFVSFLQQWEEDTLEQMHHSRAGSPSELLCKLSGSAHMQGVSPARTDL